MAGSTTPFTSEKADIHFLQFTHGLSHRPEPHILLFRRPLGTDPLTGKVDPELEREAKEQYQEELMMNQRK